MPAIIAAERQSVQLKAIERALDLLLVELERHQPPSRERWVEDLHDKIHGYVRDETGFIQMGKGRSDRPPLSRAGSRAVALYGPDPVRAALWNGVRSLGESLYALGLDAAMADACQRLRDMKPGHDQFRASILNSAWDGIGNWHA